MQTSQTQLAAALTIAIASSVAHAEQSFFSCAISSKSSALVYSSDTDAPFPGSFIGNYSPKSNPGGTRTLPGVSGGSGNVAINCLASLSVSGDVPTVPTGSFVLGLDLSAFTVSVEDFSLDVLGGQPADLGARLLLSYDTFHSVNPNAIYPGGLTTPIVLGDAQVSTLTVVQSTASQEAFLLEEGEGLYSFTMQLEAGYTLAATARGESLGSGETFTAILPLYGTVTVDEGGGVSVSIALEHTQTADQPIGIAPFAAEPIGIPTVLPPGSTAGVLLSGGASSISISIGLSGTIGATGVPEARDGDVNGDASVNAEDLTILLNYWGQPGPTDLDADGTTGPMDLAIMLGNWG